MQLKYYDIIKNNFGGIYMNEITRNMFPSINKWKSLGFKFNENDSTTLSDFVLPEGWSIKEFNGNIYNITSNKKWYGIMDEYGRFRGNIHCENNNGNYNVSMNLFTRYYVYNHYLDEKNKKYEVCFGSIEECKAFYKAGEIDTTVLSKEEAELKVEELNSKCLAFAKEDFPEFYDATAYWDMNPKKEMIKEKVKQRTVIKVW